MGDPLVSVHMITYNQVSYIAKAIESVLAQKTDFLFELVIGEDCSTDGTAELVFDYKKKHPKIINVVTSDSNVGMVNNVYRTAFKCRGKYIAFCEGDDYWHRSDKLQKQLECLEKNPNCGLVCSDFNTHDIKTGKTEICSNFSKGRNPERMKDIIYTLRGVSGIQTCTVMVKAEIYKNILDSSPSFYQDISQPCLDRPVWIEFLMKSDIAYIDESLATYNRLEYSATNDKDPRKILKISIRMKEQILTMIDKYKISNEEREIHMNDLWRRKLKLAFYDNNVKLAIECKKELTTFSLIEKIQYLGACNKILKCLFSPLFKFILRNIVPPSKY